MATPPNALPYIGLLLDSRFEVTNYIHEGNFCYVFEAWDGVASMLVAVKILKPGVTADGVLEFDEETRLLEMLTDASNVVTSYGAGSANIALSTAAGASFTLPVRYMALEHAHASLARLLPHRDAIPWIERIALFRGIVKGVHQMHHLRVVHRDIKADNILVFRLRRNEVVAKIADLGRSRLMSASRRFAPEDYLAGRGDMGFASPELLWLQGEDAPDCWRRVDMYQLGSVLFEIATGQGLTTLALGDWRSIMGRTASMSSANRIVDFHGHLSDLRSMYERPYAILQSALPPPIRFEGLRLVRQLTDPDPERRERRGFGTGQVNPWNMEWLLRRIDILALLLETSVPARDRRRAS
jgi:eukaryotic-like serine/threonine-protein kinase